MDFIDKTVNNGNSNTNKNKNNKSTKTRSNQIIRNSKHLFTGTAIFIAAILVISGSNMRAFADNVQDGIEDTISNPTQTITAGGSITTQYRLIANSAPSGDISGCNVDASHPATITINHPGGVTVTPSTVILSRCANPPSDPGWSAPVQFSSSTPGTYQITVSVSGGNSGSGWNTGAAQFQLVVNPAANTDTKPPVLTLPGTITAEATGPGGATVAYQASANDDPDGPLTPSCSPASGSTFPLGTTTVHCSATDGAGNTANDQFDVTVVDTTAPTFSTTPSVPPTEAETSQGSPVTYPLPTATDLVTPADQIIISCSQPSGSTFPIGTTTVQCTATDRAGNSAQPLSFDIVVQDTIKPSIFVPSILGPYLATGTTTQVSYLNDLTTNANYKVSDLGPSGGVVTPADQIRVTCTPTEQNSAFTIGPNSVTCTAIDASGNQASATFELRIIYPQFSWKPPTDPTGPNVFKLGSSIPAKFFLGINGIAVPQKSIAFSITKVDTKPDGPTNEVTSSLPGDTGPYYRWDSTALQYIYVVSTKSLSLTLGTYKISALLDDGTLRSVYVDVNK